MAPFWVGLSKQRKKPGWRRSTNCVLNEFFQLSPSGRNEKTPLGSNFTIAVSCHHFGWAYPSSRKSRVNQDRPIAFKTRFFIFPIQSETKKHPWDRILQFLLHATILGRLIQATEKAGLTKVDELRSKRVFSTFPIGAKRKNTLGIEFYNCCFMPPFSVGLSKQRKKPGWRRSTNCVLNAFFQLSPSGRNEKTPLGSNFTISVSCHNFGRAFPSSGKSRDDEGRPIAFKTRFFNFPHRVETKKQPWDRILQFRFYATILGGLFQAAKKTPCWRRSSYCVQNAFFSTFPIEAKRKTALGSNFTISVLCHNFGRAFPSSGKSRIDEGRPIAFKTGFFYFPHRGETKKHLWDRILQFRFHGTILGGLIQATEKAGFTKVDQLRSKRVFQLSPSGRNEKTGLGWNFTISVLCHHFGWDFPRSKKNAVLTKVVQLRSKRVFSTFPIGAKRKNTLGIEFYNFGFMPPFWVGFSKQWKKPGLQSSSNCVQNTFFKLSLSGRNEKKTLGIYFTISVSCHHFGWAFPSSGKSRVYKVRPIAFKTRFFNFPYRVETKKKPLGSILQFRFDATILKGLFQAAEKAGWTKVVQLRSKRVFSTFPILARQKKKQPWDQILQFRFHATILGGIFQAAEKAGFTKVVQLRSKHIFKLSISGRNEKKKPLGSKFTISLSCHHFGWDFPSSGKSRVYEGRPIAFKTHF